MMNKKTLKSLKNDKRAVSPVIGVILMVAITVILAAVIAAFVFGVSPPAATIDLYFTNVVVDAGSPTTITATLVGSAVIDVATADTTELVLKEDIGDTWRSVKPTQLSFILSDPDKEIATGGDILDYDSSGTATAGDEVHIVISHTPTGSILLDTTVIAQ